jgi:hypothetical protein
MITKLKARWASLPPFAKIVIVLFVSSASGVIRHVFQNPNACMSATCWKGYLVSAVHAGGLAVFVYVMDSPFAKQFLPPTQNSNGPTPQV